VGNLPLTIYTSLNRRIKKPILDNVLSAQLQ
jgi:hypothetical protein